MSRLASGLGHELDKVEATAVAITPGWLRSEMTRDHFGTTEDDWVRDSLDDAGRPRIGRPLRIQ